MRYFLALLVWVLVSASQAEVPSGSVDEFIAEEMSASGAPGLAYAIVEDDVIRADARGEILRGSVERVTSDTPFLLGSVSKSFTALAVMQLVEAGKVDLDAGISDYLAVFTGRPGGAITIRQLLSHTSGYSTLQGNKRHTDATYDEDELGRRVAQIAQWTPAHGPGTRWEYSNANYQILGALIEAVSGEDYAGYVASHILQPIGMEHSFVPDGENRDGVAIGHRPWFGGKRAYRTMQTVRGIAPAGGVYASARDVALYLVVMMNGKDDVISAAGKSAMMRPASDVSPFYGLGWFVDSDEGSVSHDGTSPGVETLAAFIPAQKKGVVVLVNAGSGTGFGETARLRTGIAARALGLDDAVAGSRWGQQSVIIVIALLPVVYLFSMLWAWFHRDALRAKSGVSGMFSLWFPLLTTCVAAWIFLFPHFVGVSLATLWLYQPDLALVMTLAGVTGVVWAVFRLGVAYSGKRAAGPG
jgi:CubicO group peptidase (beta-lactamase class C family)